MLYLSPTLTSQILTMHHINHFWQNRNPFDMSLFWENDITSRNPRTILWLRQLRGACIFGLRSWQCHRLWVARGKPPLLFISKNYHQFNNSISLHNTMNKKNKIFLQEQKIVLFKGLFLNSSIRISFHTVSLY